MFRQDLSNSVQCLLRERTEKRMPEINWAMISCMLRSGKKPALWASIEVQALTEVHPVGEGGPPKISFVM